MSIKKSDKKGEFHSSPFNTLKGVEVVSDIRSAVIPEKAEKKLSTSVDDDLVFLQAMSDIKPLDSRKRKRISPENPGSSSGKSAESPKETLSSGDKELFLEALRGMKLDKSFSDAIPGVHEKKRTVSANRLNLLKKGKIELNYELDLHGLNREDSLAALDSFIKSAINHNQRAVLVITGKGLNSSDGPVLRQAVTSWLLTDGRSSVIEFSPAPADLGGEGAIVVFLKKQITRH